MNTIICPTCGKKEFKLSTTDTSIMNHGAEVALDQIGEGELSSLEVTIICTYCNYDHVVRVRNVFAEWE